MAKIKWFLLYRRDGRDKVYLYEPLKKYEVNARMRKGWKVIE